MKKHYLPNTIATLIGLVLLILGIYTSFKASKMSGPEGQKKVERGSIMIFIGVVMLLFGNAIALAIGLNMATKKIG